MNTLINKDKMKMLRFLFISIFFLAVACHHQPSVSNLLDSDDFPDAHDRIDKLSNEVKVHSKIKNAEFELFNVNGFSGQRLSLPGASSWDYKFAVAINPTDIHKWMEGMTDTTVINYDYDWIKQMVKQRQYNWQTLTIPDFYLRKGDNTILLVYKEEGILFERTTNL